MSLRILDVVLLARKDLTNVVAQQPRAFARLDAVDFHSKRIRCMPAWKPPGSMGRRAEFLYQQGYPVSVVNLTRIKRFGDSELHRNKTDKADAVLIAQFCLKDSQPVEAFADHISSCASWYAVWMTCKALPGRSEPLARASQGDVVSDIKTTCSTCKGASCALRQAIQALIQAHPDLLQQQHLLVSIPGIGNSGSPPVGRLAIYQVCRRPAAGRFCRYDEVWHASKKMQERLEN